jgi:hypothetical protein
MPIVFVKRPIKGQIKTGANLMNGQKTRSAPFPQTFHDDEICRRLSRLGCSRRDRLPSPDKPHRLLLEFQRVPRPNQSCHLKPSKADPTQSALGDVFRGQDHAIKNF